MPYGDSYVMDGNTTRCVICKRPVRSCRGSFNTNRTPLCDKPKCKLARKLQRQAERRAATRAAKEV